MTQNWPNMYKLWNASFFDRLRQYGMLEGADRQWHLQLSAPSAWLEVATYLRHEGQVEYFVLLTATHEPPYFRLRYDLRSLLHLSDIAVSFAVPVEESVPSVATVWPAAAWQEREAYDLVGVRFVGHPDLRRILLPDDWEGHPLQKGYSFPETYHGVSLRYEPPDAAL